MQSDAFIIPDWPVPANIRTMITTRSGGSSRFLYDSFNLGNHVGDDEEAVRQNRNLLSEDIGNSTRIQWVKQVHGNGVLVLDDSFVEETTEADALYTRVDNLACGVLTADCLSVFFCDDEGNEIAVAHAGWRGLVAGVLQQTLRQFEAPTSNILAYLGPVIGPCHFEVGGEVRDAFLDLEIDEIIDQESILFHESENSGKWMADLFGIAKIILSVSGIRQIYGEPICTYCEFDRFYSYRRDGETGRFASLIWKE